MNPQVLGQEIDCIHADHQQFTMGKVSQLYDPENKGEADTDYGVHAAEQKAIYDNLN